MATASPPLFRFGVISDIQYADINDGTNFTKTEKRTYRESLGHTRTAIEFWNSMNPKPDFIMQLGDLIDGQNSGTYGQGLEFDSPRSGKALAEMLEIFDDAKAPVYHAIGNHELYNFNWGELRNNLNGSTKWGNPQIVTNETFYHSFSPCEGWRCIVLNPYDISLMQDKNSPGYRAAEELLLANNPNYTTEGKFDFFAGMKGKQLRFVPFNGGLGEKQLQWLNETVKQAAASGERMFVFSHLPMEGRASNDKNIAYNYNRVLDILHQQGGRQVVAFFAGHCHRGGYFQDEQNIHHVTLQAPLTHGLSFGHVDVFGDHAALIGKGKQRTHVLGFS